MPSDIDKEKLLSLMDIYKKNLEKELGAKVERKKESVSVEYTQFKQEFLPHHFTIYERLCKLSEKILKIKPDKKREEEILEAVNIAHLNATPEGVVSFSILVPLFIFVFGSILSFSLFGSIYFVVFFMILAAALIKPFGKLAEFMANNWRLKASNQMVLCTFYVVTYMRHTSNLENALEFASQHLSPPLSLDIKKILWDIETEKYSSIKESLDNYLETWKKWNNEFIESFHLIEASLYEGEEGRRLNTLDKALDVMLEETYEKMLHYAHNLQSPITMLHMLGIILPILGLVILPLVASFMENVNWLHIAALYNIALPISVYYIGKSILSKRPTGYGDSDISEENPEIRKYRNVIIGIGNKDIQISPLAISIVVGFILLLIGISPLIMSPSSDFGFGESDVGSSCGRQYCFLEYRTSGESTLGPYGIGASILSLFVSLAFGISIGIYFKLRSKNVISIREKSKKLEDEFATALYQLGNRLGDNLPLEIAIEKVAVATEGTVSGNFFKIASMNLRRLGMNIEQAIFDRKHGAIISFPSNIIESSMKVLTQSIKKGPLIAAQALTNVSRYIKEIHKVNERLKDLMADIISSMNSQIKFLTPAIAGVVIGITSMTTTILGKLSSQLKSTTNLGEGAEAGAPTSVLEIFGNGIPTYQFQIVVGIYVVQITYILTIFANGIVNGSDKLGERYSLGKNLIRSTLLYCFISAAVMIMFNLIAGSILQTTLSGQ